MKFVTIVIKIWYLAFVYIAKLSTEAKLYYEDFQNFGITLILRKHRIRFLWHIPCESSTHYRSTRFWGKFCLSHPTGFRVPDQNWFFFLDKLQPFLKIPIGYLGLPYSPEGPKGPKDCWDQICVTVLCHILCSPTQ